MSQITTMCNWQTAMGVQYNANELIQTSCYSSLTKQKIQDIPLWIIPYEIKNHNVTENSDDDTEYKHNTFYSNS